MKNWTTLLVVSVLTMVLVACASDSGTVTLEYDEDGVSAEVTYTAVDGEVIKQTAISVTPYEAIQVSSKEEAKMLLSEAVDEYQSTEGVEHTIEYNEDSISEEVVIDYEFADLEDVAKLPGTLYDGDLKEGINLKKTVKLLESHGFKVVK